MDQCLGEIWLKNSRMKSANFGVYRTVSFILSFNECLKKAILKFEKVHQILKSLIIRLQRMELKSLINGLVNQSILKMMI